MKHETKVKGYINQALKRGESFLRNNKQNGKPLFGKPFASNK